MFFYQVAHHHHLHLQDMPAKFLYEFVWARCKICKKQVGEVRVCEPEGDHKLKRVHSSEDSRGDLISRGLGCVVFENHLLLHS